MRLSYHRLPALLMLALAITFDYVDRMASTEKGAAAPSETDPKRLEWALEDLSDLAEEFGRQRYVSMSPSRQADLKAAIETVVAAYNSVLQRDAEHIELQALREENEGLFQRLEQVLGDRPSVADSSITVVDQLLDERQKLIASFEEAMKILHAYEGAAMHLLDDIGGVAGLHGEPVPWERSLDELQILQGEMQISELESFLGKISTIPRLPDQP